MYSKFSWIGAEYAEIALRFEAVVAGVFPHVWRHYSDSPYDTMYVEKQLRLHLPKFFYDGNFSGSKTDVGNYLHDLLSPRIASYFSNLSIYRQACDPDHYLKGSKIKKLTSSTYIAHDGTESRPLFVKSLDVVLGQRIERDLHYMHSFRADAVERVGFFHADFELPFAYLSFCPCDRTYLIESIQNALGRTVPLETVVVLSRMYGLPEIPANSISSLIACCEERLSALGYKYCITAVNPLIGFSGSSLLASAFSPMALSPVAYQYDHAGLYQTRRHASHRKQKTDGLPPNIILIRGLSHAQRRVVKDVPKIVEITRGAHLNL